MAVSARMVRAKVAVHADALEAVIGDIETLGTMAAELTAGLDAHTAHLRSLPAADSTLWVRLRWLVTGR